MVSARILKCFGILYLLLALIFVDVASSDQRPCCFLYQWRPRGSANSEGNQKKNIGREISPGRLLFWHPNHKLQNSLSEELDDLIQQQSNKKSELLVTELSKYYRRDPKDPDAITFVRNLSALDRQTIARLLEDLHQARQNRDYQTGDRISTKLKQQFQVRIYNDPPVWTTQKGVAPDSYLRKKEEKIAEEMIQLYGPYGHPYAQVGDDIDTLFCPLSFSDVQSLLAQEVIYRSQGNYEEADAVLFELMINGVLVNEKSHQWRADGCSTLPESENVEHAKEIQPNDTRGYSQSQPTSASKSSSHQDDTNLTQQRVEQLIQRRWEAIVRNELHLADCLALELLKTYSVTIDDETRTWYFVPKESSTEGSIVWLSSGNVNESEDTATQTETTTIQELVPPILFGKTDSEKHLDIDPVYVPSMRSEAISDPHVWKRVEDLVKERAQKRGEGKFLEADAIRKELWHTYHVGINDKVRQWSIGGVFDECS